jgi:hypothetical protein
MGGGRSPRPETQRRPPRPKAGGGLEGGGGREPNFCELRQEVPFEAADEAAIRPGLKIQLGLQALPVVQASSGEIGFVPEPQASAMRGCLLAGYRMAGRVSAFDPVAHRGRISVKGAKAEG